MRGKGPIVIVTGSRNHTDATAIHEALAEHSPSQVWSGGARGADTTAKQWATSTRCSYREFPADWEALGNSAGCIRNAEMMSKAPATAIVLAFPKGPLDASKGTAHAVECARREGLKVKVLNQWDPKDKADKQPNYKQCQLPLASIPPNWALAKKFDR